MRALLAAPLALILAVAASCERPGASGVVSRGAPVEAGMCAEHAVLEAVCTRCNPALVTVFRSKGDWCAEHEFPESFCPICHPERRGRPAMDVAADEPPADGLRIKFRDPTVAEKAGIVTAEALPGESAGTVVATTVLVADNTRSAQVNVAAPGVIRAFRADIGSVVDRGSPLAMIESAEVADDRARLEGALARARHAEATARRETELFERGVSAERNVQEAERALQEAQAEVASARGALEMVGAGDGAAGAYMLVAPIRGVVTRREFTVGTHVEQGATIFHLLDTAVLWAEIDVPESQAALVMPGQRVELEVDGLPGERFAGRIRYVAPEIDPHTRTVRTRAELPNPKGALRANMYARAHIFVEREGSSVLVPREAVQEAKGVHLVFVPLNADEFETRRVQLSPTDGDLVAVTAGVEAGEAVVTTGSFLLKTETLKGSIGAGCCEIEPPR